MGIIFKLKKIVRFSYKHLKSLYLEEQSLNQLQQQGGFELKGKNIIRSSIIGLNTYIAVNTIVSNCSIGRYCSIGPNVIIGFGDHPTNFLSTSPKLYFREIFNNIPKKPTQEYYPSHKSVKIGNDVWIGANCYVRNGIEIGDGAIIGSGAVVLKDIPPYSIAVGIPAKVIKQRFSPEIIKELLNIKWWNYEEDKLRKIEPYLSDNLTIELVNKIKFILTNNL